MDMLRRRVEGSALILAEELELQVQEQRQDQGKDLEKMLGNWKQLGRKKEQELLEEQKLMREQDKDLG